MSSTTNNPDGSTAGAHGTRGAARDAVDAQHDRFGGFSWGAGFFGWLSATGLAVLLLAALTAGGVAIGLTQLDSVDQAADAASSEASTVGIIGGILLAVVLFIAYFAGGYVAGRMARFDGVKQGIAVWLVGILVIVVLGILTAVFGEKFNLFSSLSLPRIPINEGTLTTGGIIALVVALLITLAGAILGGIVGTRYHRKVDRVGFDAAASR